MLYYLCSAFLVHFESEILSRAHKNFSFVNGRCVLPPRERAAARPGPSLTLHPISIGNYFLSAAQAFFRSLPSAIFLFSSITNSQVRMVFRISLTLLNV